MYRHRVTILYDNSQYEKETLIQRLPSQEDTLSEAKGVEEALLQLGVKARRLEISYDRIESFIHDLLRYREEIVFNLCEDIKGEGVYEVYVASLFELLGIEYTGATPQSLGLCLDKGKAKTLLAAHGLPTPNHLVLEGEADIPRKLHFPLIVKLLHEDGSLGIDKGSVVHDAAALRDRVKKMVGLYRQPVIVEEYVDGREFNISVLGEGNEAVVLPIAEIDYSTLKTEEPKILTYASKWDEESSEYRKTIPICPISLSSPLEKTLRAFALSACKILGCRDYTRVDVRMKGKTPYVIEVNPNPCISSDAGFIRSASVAGFSYTDTIGKILGFAIARKQAKTQQANEWLKEKRLAS